MLPSPEQQVNTDSGRLEYALETVSIKEAAISLMKWTLETLLPNTFWLLNLLRRNRDFQSQMLRFQSGQNRSVMRFIKYQMLSASSVTASMGS